MQDETHQQGDEDLQVPGCGLAVYAVMMILLMLIAGSFVMLSTFFIVQAGLEEEPRALRRGAEVQVRRLQPLREAKLIDPREVPVAWYDESDARDGTTACALTGEAMLRLENDVGHKLLLTELVAVSATGAEETGMVVTATDTSGQALSCTFGPNHGGVRLFRQLEAERDRKR